MIIVIIMQSIARDCIRVSLKALIHNAKGRPIVIPSKYVRKIPRIRSNPIGGQMIKIIRISRNTIIYVSFVFGDVFWGIRVFTCGGCVLGYGGFEWGGG